MVEDNVGDDPDLSLLRRVNAIDNFFETVLLDDSFGDWELARQFGEFLVHLGHEEFVSHLILTRAYRNLGDRQRAAVELMRCQTVADMGALGPAEAEVLLPVMQKEAERLT